MSVDNVLLTIKELQKLKEKLKDVKKDIKKEEKIEDDEYLELKKALKDLKGQVKDFEEDFLEDLRSSDFYNKLREMKMETEEKIAKTNQRLFEQIGKLPPKVVQMDLETEAGMFKVQVQPEMRVYLNGKEEKPRT